MEKIRKKVLLATLAASFYIGLLLWWDYTHGGVPVHNLLARKDLPGFSNWWGAVLIPALTAFLTFRMLHSNVSVATRWRTFVGALFYGAALSAAFVANLADVPFFMLIGVITFSFFFPVYRADFFLGLVLGMVYTFGGVLPIIIVAVLSVLGLVAYKGVRPLVVWAVSFLKSKST
jgi:hypothetical protein